MLLFSYLSEPTFLTRPTVQLNNEVICGSREFDTGKTLTCKVTSDPKSTIQYNSAEVLWTIFNKRRAKKTQMEDGLVLSMLLMLEARMLFVRHFFSMRIHAPVEIVVKPKPKSKFLSVVSLNARFTKTVLMPDSQILLLGQIHKYFFNARLTNTV